MSIDETFLTTICMQINFIIAMLQFHINFQCEEHLVNYSYQASRNLFGLTGPLGDIYPTFKFTSLNCDPGLKAFRAAT